MTGCPSGRSHRATVGRAADWGWQGWPAQQCLCWLAVGALAPAAAASGGRSCSRLLVCERAAPARAQQGGPLPTLSRKSAQGGAEARAVCVSKPIAHLCWPAGFWEVDEGARGLRRQGLLRRGPLSMLPPAGLLGLGLLLWAYICAGQAQERVAAAGLHLVRSGRGFLTRSRSLNIDAEAL